MQNKTIVMTWLSYTLVLLNYNVLTFFVKRKDVST